MQKKYESFWKTTMSELSFRSALRTAANGDTGHVAVGDIRKCSPEKKNWYCTVHVRQGEIVRVSKGDLAAPAASLGKVLVNDGMLAAWPTIVFRFTVDKAGDWLTVQAKGNAVPGLESYDIMETEQPSQPDDKEQIEGLDSEGRSWGDYPLDEMLIRSDNRTIHDVIRRIEQGRYVMDPDFQRDFIWPADKQSKLIESVIMRIPLPVFYLAEDDEGRVVVVDGLQRLSTFDGFVKNKLKLRLADRSDLNGKTFSELSSKFQNRVEDCNLIFYVIDSKVPERARLDIFERVNGGVPLTRQQMRNSLFMGKATRFLKQEAQTDVFRQATGESLRTSTMRDREFVNRFCAFQILSVIGYRRDDMDEFLAESLRSMNRQSDDELSRLSYAFRRGLENN